jgi:hypothetical protein
LFFDREKSSFEWISKRFEAVASIAARQCELRRHFLALVRRSGDISSHLLRACGSESPSFGAFLLDGGMFFVRAVSSRYLCLHSSWTHVVSEQFSEIGNICN